MLCQGHRGREPVRARPTTSAAVMADLTHHSDRLSLDRPLPGSRWSSVTTAWVICFAEISAGGLCCAAEVIMPRISLVVMRVSPVSRYPRFMQPPTTLAHCSSSCRLHFRRLTMTSHGNPL